MATKEHILLVAGGASAERAVSKNSSKAIYSALTELGYAVSVIDPAYGAEQPDDVAQFFDEKDFAPVSEKNYLAAFSLPVVNSVDAVFLGLHGQFGEDGTVQSILELLGKRYTGSGVLASSLAMDKHTAKIILKDHGVPVPAELFLPSREFDREALVAEVTEKLKFPCVIKPNDQGSTCGLTVCYWADEVIPAVELAFQFSKSVLLEEFIQGRELTVGIINGEVLPVLEIRPKHELYDYECKYTHGMTEYFVPADIPADIFSITQELTKIVFDALGCKSYGRADFRLTPDGRLSCLEMNTLPGMTSTSLVPKMAKAAGISFPEVIERIVRDCLS
jgi:D-alanine-D-alanine ligase